MLLSLPIVMAIWFAPALVVFNAMQPVDALKASFHACLKNTLVFLVYGLMAWSCAFSPRCRWVSGSWSSDRCSPARCMLPIVTSSLAPERPYDKPCKH
jgi:hypothetical protein